MISAYHRIYVLCTYYPTAYERFEYPQICVSLGRSRINSPETRENTISWVIWILTNEYDQHSQKVSWANELICVTNQPVQALGAYCTMSPLLTGHNPHRVRLSQFRIIPLGFKLCSLPVEIHSHPHTARREVWEGTDISFLGKKPV